MNDVTPGRSRHDSEGVVLGVVLAAGAGSRYGMPKILAEDGRWLETAVAALRAGGCDDIVVAMGAAVVDPPAGVGALVVTSWSDGMGATVACAVRWAASRPQAAAVVLHVVDVPDVGADVVSRIVDAGGRRREVLARAVFDGRPGHPVYMGADHFGPALEMLGGDVGAQVYLRQNGMVLVECGDLASGIDVDERE